MLLCAGYATIKTIENVGIERCTCDKYWFVRSLREKLLWIAVTTSQERFHMISIWSLQKKKHKQKNKTGLSDSIVVNDVWKAFSS